MVRRLAIALGHALAWRGVAAILDALNEPERFTQRLQSEELRAVVRLGVVVVEQVLGPSVLLVLVISTLGCAFGAIARAFVRAHAQSQRQDPLVVARSWVASRKWLVVGLAAAPALAWSACLAPGVWIVEIKPFVWALSILGVAPALVALARAGLNGLLSPTLEACELESEELSAADIQFKAVAVTPETCGAVAALAGVSCVAMVCMATLPLGDLLFIALVTFVALAMLGTAAFLRASRVWIGIDGVRVSGTSQFRFLPYADLDDAYLAASDLILVASGRKVLRLQLHGADATRADVLLARVVQNIALARKRHTLPVERHVEATPTDQLAQIVAGAGDFRKLSLSREELWEVVEGPAVSGGVRAAAAQALAASRPLEAREERVRMRVASALCAEPRARAVLEQLAAEEEAVGEASVRAVGLATGIAE